MSVGLNTEYRGVKYLGKIDFLNSDLACQLVDQICIEPVF
jgi:hypothetical protein